MSNIPKARELLQAILDDNIIDQAATKRIKAAMKLLTRESPLRKSKISVRLTDEHKTAIRKYAKENPDWSYAQIGRAAKVPNIGRVSEVLRSQR